eukprot:6197555-Pleurochrysis_carterae.AAC.1
MSRCVALPVQRVCILGALVCSPCDTRRREHCEADRRDRRVGALFPRPADDDRRTGLGHCHSRRVTLLHRQVKVLSSVALPMHFESCSWPTKGARLLLACRAEIKLTGSKYWGPMTLEVYSYTVLHYYTGLR